MKITKARKLVETYINGWKANNTSLICKSLSKNCVVIESHGPTYRGIATIKEWVGNWINGKYKVNKWDITSFFLTKDTAIFEWKFAFSSSSSSVRTIDGISIVKFKGNKISYIREYRATKPLYEWKKELVVH